MKSSRNIRKFATLAALTTATTFAFGAGCIQAILASIGATLF